MSWSLPSGWSSSLQLVGDGWSEDEPPRTVWASTRSQIDYWASALGGPRVVGEPLVPWSSYRLVALDLETTGLHPRSLSPDPAGILPPCDPAVVMATLTGVVGDERRLTNVVVPLWHPGSSLRLIWSTALADLVDTLLASGAGLTLHNGKFDGFWIKAATDRDVFRSVVWDSEVAARLQDENRSATLQNRATGDLGAPPWKAGFDFSKTRADQVDLYPLGEYASLDTEWSWRLARYQMAALEPKHSYLLATVVEALPVLVGIEDRGLLLDHGQALDELNQVEETYRTTIDALERLHPGIEGESSVAGGSLWFRTAMDRAVELGEARVVDRTPKGVPSWSASALKRQTGSRTASLVLEARDALKQAEFIRSWETLTGLDGALHPTYRVTSTVTGRLSCLAPDTLIDMPRDLTRHPLGVPISEVKTGDWVYSFDVDMRLTLRQVSWVGPTKTARTVVVTFENSDGEVRRLTCTPDHLVRMYDGSWRHAAYLMRGASKMVLSMVRRSWSGTTEDRYIQFFPHSNSRHTPPSVSDGARYGTTSGGKSKEHRWVMSQVLGRRLSTKWDVNHIDGNKSNNHPSNLEYLSREDHRRQTHADGTFGKSQPWAEVFTGKNDFRVVSVEEGPVTEVWDMTVPEDHQFVANGIVVHNCANPNLQQVARKQTHLFVPRPGNLFVYADLSQAELRVIAHLSRSEPMRQAFRDGKDLHRLVVSALTGKDPEDVTAEERQLGKAINFGFAFGMGPRKFEGYARDNYGVELTTEEAYDAHAVYMETWQLRQWHAEVDAWLQEYGEIDSLVGRTRHLADEVWSRDRYLEGEAFRQGINSPVQGLIPDMLLMGLTEFSRQVYLRPPLVAPLVATVHDSALGEAPEDEAVEVRDILADSLTRGICERLDERFGVTLAVPLVVEASVQTRWGEIVPGTEVEVSYYADRSAA